jgi:hypothetical protein
MRRMTDSLAAFLALALSLGQPAMRPAVPDSMRVNAQSVDDFKLPPKAIFDRAMPRYPNLWFLVDRSMAPSYDAAVKLVTNGLREAMRLREDFGPFDNPEGCDFETRLEHLQPWLDRAARALQHAHAFHMRYYYSALARQNLGSVEIKMADGRMRSFFRFAASVHYEVEHFNPNHADVETCPLCGRTGEYAALKGNLVEIAHDPLGLELVMKGTVRGEVVRFDDQGQQPVGSMLEMPKFQVQSFVFPGMTDDRNTLRVGVAVLTPKKP